EASASGLPAILSHAANLDGIVAPGETGWEVPTGRQRPLVGALAEALALPPARWRELGHVGLGSAPPRAPDDARALVRAMADALAHRGPDASAVHQAGAAVLGHTRLAIIDLSTDANQPMVSADGQVTLVFNGEIYNFHELAAELRAAGVALRTKSDTEVLLELYRLHGPSFVGKMRGMFAFAIWDAPRRRLMLGRDRLGKKPLFFHLGARGLSFASELRALLADADIARKPEARALHAYLSLGFVPTTYAAIEGVR